MLPANYAGRGRHREPAVWRRLLLRAAAAVVHIQQLHIADRDVQHGHVGLAGPHLQVKPLLSISSRSVVALKEMRNPASHMLSI